VSTGKRKGRQRRGPHLTPPRHISIHTSAPGLNFTAQSVSFSSSHCSRMRRASVSASSGSPSGPLTTLKMGRMESSYQGTPTRMRRAGHELPRLIWPSSFSLSCRQRSHPTFPRCIHPFRAGRNPGRRSANTFPWPKASTFSYFRITSQNVTAWTIQTPSKVCACPHRLDEILLLRTKVIGIASSSSLRVSAIRNAGSSSIEGSLGDYCCLTIRAFCSCVSFVRKAFTTLATDYARSPLSIWQG